MIAMNTVKKIGPQFHLGKIAIAQQAYYTIQEIADKKFGANTMGAAICASQIREKLLKDHLRLKQGKLCESDHQININAVKRIDSEGKPDNNGNLRERIYSAFEIEGIKFLVITEWDESVTTILLPEEY